MAIVVPDLDLIDFIPFFGDFFPACEVCSYFPDLNLVAAKLVMYLWQKIYGQKSKHNSKKVRCS